MDNRSIIFEAAYDLFIKRGYKKTTIRAIAKKADANVALVGYYFENKEKLGAEVFRTLIKRIISEVDYSLISLNNSIEVYYYGYLMIQYYLNTNSRVYQFYIEFLAASDLNLYLNEGTRSKLVEIIKDYELKVSDRQLYDYCAAVIGAERTLLFQKYNGNLAMSYWELNATLARIALCLIGVDRNEIEQAIEGVDGRLRALPYNWDILQ